MRSNFWYYTVSLPRTVQSSIPRSPLMKEWDSHTSCARATGEIRTVWFSCVLCFSQAAYIERPLAKPLLTKLHRGEGFASIVPIYNYLWVSVTFYIVDNIIGTHSRWNVLLCAHLLTCIKINTYIVWMCLCFLGTDNLAKLWCCIM